MIYTVAFFAFLKRVCDFEVYDLSARTIKWPCQRVPRFKRYEIEGGVIMLQIETSRQLGEG